jgi:hypothetical protein
MIAIRPPEYFPRSAYISLIQHVDHFVLADTFQYSRQSFQNRSKLRNPNGWQWITVPLQGYAYGEPITDVEIDHNDRWQERHWRSFMYNYRSTMYFEFYEDDFRPIFDEPAWTNLADLTCESVRVETEMLQVDTPIVRASELEGAPETVEGVLRALGEADAPLLCPPDAAQADAEAGHNVHVLTFDLEPYHQNFDGFEPEMSAMDFAFNYGPDAASHIYDAAEIAPYKPSP